MSSSQALEEYPRELPGHETETTESDDGVHFQQMKKRRKKNARRRQKHGLRARQFETRKKLETLHLGDSDAINRADTDGKSAGQSVGNEATLQQAQGSDNLRSREIMLVNEIEMLKRENAEVKMENAELKAENAKLKAEKI